MICFPHNRSRTVPTDISLLGLDEAKNQASLVGKQAHDALNSVFYDTSILAALIDYLLERTN